MVLRSVHYGLQTTFPIDREEASLLPLSSERVARHPFSLIGGHFEDFAIDFDPIAWLVGGGHLPPAGLEVGDSGLGLAEQLGELVGGQCHWGIIGQGGWRGGRRPHYLGEEAWHLSPGVIPNPGT